jgi:hypothetical protein
VPKFGEVVARFLSGRYLFLARYARKGRLYSVAQFPDGKYGRVVGDVAPIGDPLIAPVSGLPCVFYILRVSDPFVRHRGTGDPETIARGSSDAAFFLDDGTGRALVDPRGAIGFLDSPVATGTCERPPRALWDLVQQAGQTMLMRHVYAEWAIPVGARVSVVGGGMREPDPDAAPAPEYRGAAPMRLRIAKTEPYALMISDYGDTFR